jgi:hypothetical protein
MRFAEDGSFGEAVSLYRKAPAQRWAIYSRKVVRFKVLTAASMMFRVVFWDILPCKMKRRSTIILHGSILVSQKTTLNSRKVAFDTYV